MWLQKNERILLGHYYRDIGKPNERKSYHLPKLIKKLGLLSGWLKKMDALMACVWDANNNLKERGLIYEEREMADTTLNITLTLSGYDLGMRYNSWYYRSGGMWWAEHKGHWIWSVLTIIVTFIAGLVVGKLT
jgi:hypothetical protein